jgi:lipopolysaccharide export system protein LptA
VFHERGRDLDRAAQSATLDVTLAPGLSEIEDARFAQAVRFTDGSLRAASARARYAVAAGTLELSGSEPASRTPQVENDRISVYGERIDVTLAGPTMKAVGTVKSELKPLSKDAAKERRGTLPSMFKEDQLIAATAGELLYDGPASKAIYTGSAQLWQGDTSIKAGTIALDEKSGDLTAADAVVTTIPLEQETSDRRKERAQTTASSSELVYEEASRQATYLGEARLNGPQGDMTAQKIELYLRESGDELERVEAYDLVTLRDQNRETKGARLTYFAGGERYVLTGAPVVIKDECGSVTTGKRVTYDKPADTIVVDGTRQTRTQTRGGTNCR